MQVLEIAGFKLLKGYLPRPQQERLRDQLREVARIAPLENYTTPGGRRMSVRMTAAGPLGWMSDRTGYRYSPTHSTGKIWPEIPADVQEIWRAESGMSEGANSCLINYYGEGARMGLHVDDTEGRFDAPVVSISLGDQALFRMGGPHRGDKTVSHWLESGDVVVMDGAARLAHHGIDRIKFGSSTLLPQGGRLNITLRMVER